MYETKRMDVATYQFSLICGVVKTNEITSIEIKIFKGDEFVSKDTNFYTLRLTGGKIVTVTLYHYGEEAEKEILETIKGSIV